VARRLAILFVLAACLAASLAACGRKSSVQLPPGEQDERRTYPTK
jgi:predicted small lipoprotein YifL